MNDAMHFIFIQIVSMDVQTLTLRAMRMMRFVRLRLSTSELVEARDMTSRAVASRGASVAAARPGQHKDITWGRLL